jgi:hypothetical protein
MQSRVGKNQSGTHHSRDGKYKGCIHQGNTFGDASVGDKMYDVDRFIYISLQEKRRTDFTLTCLFSGQDQTPVLQQNKKPL